MYTAYFQHRPRGSPVEWTSDCSEATILNTYLSAHIDVKTAANKLTLPSPDPTDDIGDKQWRLWSLVFDVAADLPQTQRELVALLKSFRTLENPGDWAIDWSRLASFGSMWRDAWEFFSTHRLITSPPPSSSPFLTPLPSDRWINFNAFSARLVAAFVGNVGVIFGFCLLRDALEETLSSPAKEVEPTAAAQWILWAGSAVFKADNEQVSEGGQWDRGLAKESQLWKGEVGFGRARWEFWKGRFEALGLEVKGAAGQVLKDAAMKMREIEEGAGG